MRADSHETTPTNGNGRRDFDRLRATLRWLYHGESRTAARYRIGVIAIDIAIIAFFIAAPILKQTRSFLYLDYAVAAILALDLAARALAWRNLKSWIKRPIVWVDFFVLLTLLAPFWFINLAFLRVLRLWTLVSSEFFWNTVGRRWGTRRLEDSGRAAATLLTFIFVVTGFVYTSFSGAHPDINNYLDALYFTVATLTTTGFGDIVLPGAWGKVISIFTMIAGITLFVRFAQALLQPHKVRFPCPTCGLVRHDYDAVHCKACGTALAIPNEVS